MSRFKEYLKLIPKGLKNLDHVVEGIASNVMFEYNMLAPDERDEIIKRRLICEGCEFMNRNARNYISDRTDQHCILCGCPIASKTACLDCNCGIEEYNKKALNPIPLKWKTYDKK